MDNFNIHYENERRLYSFVKSFNNKYRFKFFE